MPVKRAPYSMICTTKIGTPPPSSQNKSKPTTQKPAMKTKKPVIAISYDFDGTLAPGNMQEHQFLPKMKTEPSDFWKNVKEVAKAKQADEVLVYMKLMLEKAKENKQPVNKESFRSFGKSINLFDGVEEWFSRINKYAKEHGVSLQHYLISSGNDEIIRGTKIAKQFDAIYASKYLFDENETAEWPALAVNYTTKTQYLFRINKGIRDISDNNAVNRFTPKEDRPVPFENMIFIGDGSTDIPCFRLIKDQGGLSIAVFRKNVKNSKSNAIQYYTQGRVHAAIPADYTEGSSLDEIVKARVDYISKRHVLETKISSKTAKEAREQK